MYYMNHMRQAALDELGIIQRSAFWCFTICNYNADDEERLTRLFNTIDETSGIE
jgi:hypothetical protein